MHEVLFNDVSQSSFHPDSNRQQNKIFPRQPILERGSGAAKDKVYNKK